MWKPGAQKPKAPTATGPPSGMKKEAAAAPTPGPNEPRPTTKSSLSNKTLAMKFMQRNKATSEQRRQAILAEQKKNDTWATTATEASDPADCDHLVCTRDVPDPSLPAVFTRRSFGGFNKAVEDEYRDVTKQMRFAASEEKELREEVSAEEMASRMVKYTGLLRGPQASTRMKKRPRKH